MGQVIFVVLVLGGLGLFFYRQSQCATEQKPVKPCEGATDIPESCDNLVASCVEESVVEAAAPKPTAQEPTSEASCPVAEASSVQDALAWRLLQRIKEKPGLMQVELYKQFPHENRKQLQATLLQLDRDALVRREKKGSSYQLYPHS
ncbi:MAG: hypothetical protein JXR59_10500 [Desulfuromonadaceae bacterium]|nr:hypothetical protein [Desulfuromonadaceae bacterium]